MMLRFTEAGARTTSRALAVLSSRTTSSWLRTARTAMFSIVHVIHQEHSAQVGHERLGQLKPLGDEIGAQVRDAGYASARPGDRADEAGGNGVDDLDEHHVDAWRGRHRCPLESNSKRKTRLDDPLSRAQHCRTSRIRARRCLALGRRDHGSAAQGNWPKVPSRRDGGGFASLWLRQGRGSPGGHLWNSASGTSWSTASTAGSAYSSSDRSCRSTEATVSGVFPQRVSRLASWSNWTGRAAPARARS